MAKGEGGEVRLWKLRLSREGAMLESWSVSRPSRQLAPSQWTGRIRGRIAPSNVHVRGRPALSHSTGRGGTFQRGRSILPRERKAVVTCGCSCGSEMWRCNRWKGGTPLTVLGEINQASPGLMICSSSLKTTRHDATRFSSLLLAPRRSGRIPHLARTNFSGSGRRDRGRGRGREP